MEGSQPKKGIDPQMIRDQGADAGSLDREIREIELEALALQAHLRQVRPMSTARKRTRRWRHAS